MTLDEDVVDVWIARDAEGSVYADPDKDIVVEQIQDNGEFLVQLVRISVSLPAAEELRGSVAVPAQPAAEVSARGEVMPAAHRPAD